MNDGVSWNPLRCDGTSLPPNWLLAAKLLAFFLLPGTRLLAAGPPFLPFVHALDAPWAASWLAPATWGVSTAATLCLLLNRVVRQACVILAICVFTHILGHRLEYANNLVFTGVFLLLIGCYDGRLGVWPARVQLALVYGGASLNKALDLDWWTGRAFDTLMLDALHVHWYASVAARLPPHTVGMCAAALTIAIEGSIAATMLLSRDARIGARLMLGFHLAMLVATVGQLSFLFLYAAVAVAPLFLTVSSVVPVFAPVRVARALSRSALGETPIWWAAAILVRLLPRMLGAAA